MFTENGITTISASAFAIDGSRSENIYGKTTGTHRGVADARTCKERGNAIYVGVGGTSKAKKPRRS